MTRPLRAWMGFTAILALAGGPAAGQPGRAAPPPGRDAPAKAAPKPAPAIEKLPYRKLAPGVVQPIEADKRQEESVSRHSVTELLAVDQTFDFAKEVPFRGDIWTLEFKFKPVRTISVEIPQPTGQSQRKLIWYMVYSVTNPGKIIHPVEDTDKTYTVDYINKPVRFIPVFQFEAHNRLPREVAAGDAAPRAGTAKVQQDTGFTKVYTDRIIPLAMRAIRLREDRNRTFLNSAEMAAKPIPAGETVWGIATWGDIDDIDPRLVWFSIYVEGLTNAYRFTDDPAKFKPNKENPKNAIGRGYRVLYRKMLKLNFWRPGDEYTLSEEDIRYGLPHGVPGGVDHEWVYR